MVNEIAKENPYLKSILNSDATLTSLCDVQLEIVQDVESIRYFYAVDKDPICKIYVQIDSEKCVTKFRFAASFVALDQSAEIALSNRIVEAVQGIDSGDAGNAIEDALSYLYSLEGIQTSDSFNSKTLANHFYCECRNGENKTAHIFYIDSPDLDKQIHLQARMYRSAASAIVVEGVRSLVSDEFGLPNVTIWMDYARRDISGQNAIYSLSNRVPITFRSELLDSLPPELRHREVLKTVFSGGRAAPTSEASLFLNAARETEFQNRDIVPGDIHLNIMQTDVAPTSVDASNHDPASCQMPVPCISIEYRRTKRSLSQLTVYISKCIMDRSQGIAFISALESRLLSVPGGSSGGRPNSENRGFEKSDIGDNLVQSIVDEFNCTCSVTADHADGIVKLCICSFMAGAARRFILDNIWMLHGAKLDVSTYNCDTVDHPTHAESIYMPCTHCLKEDKLASLLEIPAWPSGPFDRLRPLSLDWDWLELVSATRHLFNQVSVSTPILPRLLDRSFTWLAHEFISGVHCPYSENQR